MVDRDGAPGGPALWSGHVCDGTGPAAPAMDAPTPLSIASVKHPAPPQQQPGDDAMFRCVMSSLVVSNNGGAGDAVRWWL